MKLLFLVSLPFLASTNVALAKSTLNEGRQNVTDSLDVSPRGLSTVKQETTAGTRHQAENAEERAPTPTVEKLALKLDEKAPVLHRNSGRFQGRHGPAALYRRLNFKRTDTLFGSNAFKKWMEGVEIRNSEKMGKIIIESLREKIRDDKLFTMLIQAKGKTLSDREYTILFSYLVRQWLAKGGDSMQTWVRPIALDEPEPGTPAAVFRMLDFDFNQNLFTSMAFREWMLAVEKRKKNVGKTISEALLQNFSMGKLVMMLTEAQGGEVFSDEELKRLTGYIASYWLKNVKKPVSNNQ